jgi:anti-anti-sigma regulatory factor
MTATLRCDRAGTDAIARVCQQAEAKGTELRLVIAARAVWQMIMLAGLEGLVSVFTTLEAAQAAEPGSAVVLPMPPVS